MDKPRRRLRPQRGHFTRSDLERRWGRSKNTLENWIYRQRILKPLPSSRGQGRGLLFSKAEVRRFETTYNPKQR